MPADASVQYVKGCHQLMLSLLQCSICLDVFRDPVSTPCSHSFCRQCITRSLSGSKSVTCPLCKAPFTRRGITERPGIRNMVQGVHNLIAVASKDAGYDIMYEEVTTRLCKETTREAYSPTDTHPSSSSKTSFFPTECFPKGTDKVKTWLKEVAPSTLSQESEHPASTQNPGAVDSDSDFDSVSQVKPESVLNVTSVSELKTQTKTTVKVMQASATIEDEASINVDQSVNLEPLNPLKKELYKRKVMSTKLTSDSAKIAHPKNLPASKINILNPSIVGDSPKNISLNSIPIEQEKENAIHEVATAATRSPGWSRIKKMKVEFHQGQKSVLRSNNNVDTESQVAIIEEAGSGGEEPCRSLSSPSLRTKERIDQIVLDLEAEIELCERGSSSSESKGAKALIPSPVLSHSTSSKVEGIQRLPESIPCPQNRKIKSGKVSPMVTFLKLGNFAVYRSCKIPFLLKGSLLHIPYSDSFTPDCSRLSDSKSVHTQWSPQTNFDDRKGSNSFDFNMHEVPCLKSQNSIVIEGTQRRSDGALTDFMDAETVVVTQPAQQKCSDLIDAKLASCVETIRVDSVIESQKDDEVLGGKSQILDDVTMFSCDEEENGAALEDEQQACLDDSSSSEVNEKKVSKRIRILSSSDSSDTEIGAPALPSNIAKKRKSQASSKSEDSFHSISPDLDVSLLGGSMCIPDIEANIKANIEAGLKNAESMRSDWYNPENLKIAERAPASPLSQKDVFADSNTQVSTLEVESEGDSDVVVGTPVVVLDSRDTTQSDDIVPDSQPSVRDKAQISLSAPTYRQNPEPPAPHHKSLQSDSPRKCSGSRSPIDVEHSVPKAGTSFREVIPASNATTESAEKCIPTLNATEQQKCSFICSSLPAVYVTQVQKLAQMVGGEFSSKYSANTSHLVVKVNDKNAADKTLKYLCTVAAGKWVVSFQWVLDSLDAKKLLPEEPYEVVDSSGEQGPRKSRLAHRDGTLLFKNFEFYCLCDFNNLSKAEMEDLLRECGAIVVQDPTKFSFSDKSIAISLGVYDEEKEEELLPWLDKYGSLLIQHDWVLDCIGKFMLTSLYSNIMCDTPDDLQTIGLPSYLVEPTDSDSVDPTNSEQ